MHAGSSSRPPDCRPPTKKTWVLPPVMTAAAVAAGLDGLFHSRKSSTATAAPAGVADHRYRAVKRGAASSCRGVGPCVVQWAREANQTPSKGRQPGRIRYPRRQCHSHQLECGKLLRVATVNSPGLEWSRVARRDKLCNFVEFMRECVMDLLYLTKLHTMEAPEDDSAFTSRSLSSWTVP